MDKNEGSGRTLFASKTKSPMFTADNNEKISGSKIPCYNISKGEIEA